MLCVLPYGVQDHTHPKGSEIGLRTPLRLDRAVDVFPRGQQGTDAKVATCQGMLTCGGCGTHTSFRITMSPTAYSGFNPPAAFVAIYLLNIGLVSGNQQY
jgi:hypothetical protein